MNCEQAKRHLTALEKGELEEEMAQALRAHLQQCEDCAADSRQMQVGTALLSLLEPEEVPEGFAERVMEHLPERRGWEAWGFGWKLAWGGGLAVIAGGFLGLGMFLGRMTAEKGLPPTLREETPYLAKAPAAQQGYEAERSTVTITPAEEGVPPRLAGQPPFAPEERVSRGEPGRAFMAEIGAPVPVRKRREPVLLAAAPPSVRGVREEKALPAGAAPTMPVAPAAPSAVGALAAASAAASPEREETAVAGEGRAVAGASARPGGERRFDLRLEGADLVDALRLVANVEGRSLVVGPGVKGTVTLRMRNVTAGEALEKLKKEFDLSVEERDETMVVKRLEESSAVPGETALG